MPPMRQAWMAGGTVNHTSHDGAARGNAAPAARLLFVLFGLWLHLEQLAPFHIDHLGRLLDHLDEGKACRGQRLGSIANQSQRITDDRRQDRVDEELVPVAVE